MLIQKKRLRQREGLSDEQKAIFDILRQGKTLEEKRKARNQENLCRVARRTEKGQIESRTMGRQVPNCSCSFQLRQQETLFEVLPYPTYQTSDIDQKTQMVYAHLKNQYYGGGMSIYGQY